MWGVTQWSDKKVAWFDVSIHTPVWGVTNIQAAAPASEHLVSIHTPVWGVTHCAVSRHASIVFHSTRPCGA